MTPNKPDTEIDEIVETEEVDICDVTLREWDQAPFTCFTKNQKAITAILLNEIWVKTIEAWFAASQAEKENWNIEFVIDSIWKNSFSTISSLWMTTDLNSIDSLNALKNAEKKRIHIFIATPNDHINDKFPNFWNTLEERRNKVIENIVKQINLVKNYAKENNIEIEIQVSAEAASNNSINSKKTLDLKSDEFNYLVKWVRETIKAWAKIINIPDTLWNLLPHEMEKLFKELNKKTKHLRKNYDFIFSCHIHNDLAWSTHWAISAIRWWARQIETTINWIWERTWNTPLHEVIWIINEKLYSIIDWKKVTLPNIKTELIWPVSRFVDKILKFNKKLAEPFIWPLSVIDWSWVHNANPWLYGWWKDYKKYWIETIEPFFSPRWWRNQITEILKNYWIKEDSKSDIISNVTKKACLIAETSKILYHPNIYAIYLEEIWDFKINNINFDEKWVKVSLTLFWKEIIINWEIDNQNDNDDNQWFINWIIKWINKYLWENIVDLTDINIYNEPSLKQSVEELLEDMENTTTIEIRSDFKNKLMSIIWENWNWKNSEQSWVSIIKMIINWNKIKSIKSWHDVTRNNIKSIIYWVLPELIKKLNK